MKIEGPRRENVANVGLRMAPLAKVAIGVMIATGIVRIVVPALEDLIEGDRLHVVKRVIVVPRDVAEIHVTTEVPTDAVLAIVVQTEEVQMNAPLATADLKRMVPVRVAPTVVDPINVVQVALVTNTSDGPVTENMAIADRKLSIVTVESTGGLVVPSLAIAGPIIGAASPVIVAQADRNSVIETNMIAGLVITGSDEAKDADLVEASLLIVALKAEDSRTVTAIIADSVAEALNTTQIVDQAAANSDIVDRTDTTSDITPNNTVTEVPKAEDSLTMTATIADSMVEALNIMQVAVLATVNSDIMVDQIIMVAARTSGIVAAPGDMNLLIMKVGARVDHNSHIAVTGTIVVGAGNVMRGLLTRDKVLAMQNTVSRDVMVPIDRDRVLIGRPWKVARRGAAQVAPVSVVVAVRVVQGLAAPTPAVLVSADILRQRKCSMPRTPIRTAS